MTIQLDDRRTAPTGDACPHLGVRDDPATHCTFATLSHRCVRSGGGVPIAIEHQLEFCLSEAHRRCPVLRGETKLPPAGARPARHWMVWAAAALVVSLLVTAAGIRRISGSRHDIGASAPAPVPTVITTPAVARMILPTAPAEPDWEAVAVPPPLPTPVSTPAPTPTPSSPVLYVIKSGDTLDQVAAFFGARPQDVIALNHLPADGRIVTGQQMLIPVGP